MFNEECMYVLFIIIMIIIIMIRCWFFAFFR